MNFPVDEETTRWLQKTISRLRCRNDWSSLASREVCWTPAFLSALIDEVDYLLTAGLGQDAYAISCHLQLLAKRIRPEQCPELELGRRSLIVWAMAVHASSCRLTDRFTEAEALFRAAFQHLSLGALPWAQGDLERRFAVYLLQRGDRATFQFIESALAAFVDLPERMAETLILRGAAHVYISHDNPAAIADFSRAAALVFPLRSQRARCNLYAAFHNIARQLIADPSQSLESLSRARKLIQLSRQHFGQGISSRKLTSIWVEGLLVFRMGWNRHGERLIEKAREGFRKLELRDEYVMATLDLALLLLEDGEPERVIDVLNSAAGFIQDRCSNAPECCAGWKPTLGKDELLRLRQNVQDQLRPTWRLARAHARTGSHRELLSPPAR